MILRAVFWIAVVSFFMPREPDLGLGRPGGDRDGIGGLMARVEAADPAKACQTRESTCATGFSLLSAFQGVAVRSLDAVRADLEQSKARQPQDN
jgi:hypothetical protein